jgi:hypothetical protein
MREMRDDVSVEDLVGFTTMIHKMRPDLKNKIVLQIEKSREGDKNLCFHLYDKYNKETPTPIEKSESTRIMISLELVMEFFGIDINATDAKEV